MEGEEAGREQTALEIPPISAIRDTTSTPSTTRKREQPETKIEYINPKTNKNKHQPNHHAPNKRPPTYMEMSWRYAGGVFVVESDHFNRFGADSEPPGPEPAVLRARTLPIAKNALSKNAESQTRALAYQRSSLHVEHIRT